MLRLALLSLAAAALTVFLFVLLKKRLAMDEALWPSLRLALWTAVAAAYLAFFLFRRSKKTSVQPVSVY